MRTKRVMAIFAVQLCLAADTIQYLGNLTLPRSSLSTSNSLCISSDDRSSQTSGGLQPCQYQLLPYTWLWLTFGFGLGFDLDQLWLWISFGFG